MHILILDHNRTSRLAHALQLSGYGLIVETVPDLEEAAHRLAALTIDAVLYDIPVEDERQSEKLETIRRTYPDTGFYATDRWEDFLKRLRKKHFHK